MENVVNAPAFKLYLQQQADAALFREPVRMVKFFEDFPFPATFISQADPDKILAGFSGRLDQGSSLVGKLDLRLTAIISATEISDQNFIREFTKNYPSGVKRV